MHKCDDGEGIGDDVPWLSGTSAHYLARVANPSFVIAYPPPLTSRSHFEKSASSGSGQVCMLGIPDPLWEPVHLHAR